MQQPGDTNQRQTHATLAAVAQDPAATNYTQANWALTEQACALALLEHFCMTAAEPCALELAAAHGCAPPKAVSLHTGARRSPPHACYCCLPRQ